MTCAPPPSCADIPAALARLNDQLRRRITRPGHNRIMLSAAVSALLGDRASPEGLARLQAVLAAVRDFGSFTADNDPYGEHDFGRFDLLGEAFFWKIDYYDLACVGTSPDATDAGATCRVLTIMLVSDY